MRTLSHSVVREGMSMISRTGADVSSPEKVMLRGAWRRAQCKAGECVGVGRGRLRIGLCEWGCERAGGRRHTSCYYRWWCGSA